MSTKRNSAPLWDRLIHDILSLQAALKLLKEAEEALDDCHLPLVRSRIDEAHYRVVTAYCNLSTLSKDSGDVEITEGIHEISQKASERRIADFKAAECATTYRNRVIRRAQETLDLSRGGSRL